MILTRPGDWPLVCAPEDEFGGDEWVPDLPSNYGNHRDLGGALDPVQYAEADRRFLELFLEAQGGRRAPDDPELLALAAALRLLGPLSHDRRPAKVAPAPLPPTLLCDLVEDYCPDLACVALDRFLGPWADIRLDRAVRAQVVSLGAFIPSLETGGSPVRRWDQERPRPPLARRAALEAAGRAPAMLWLVEGELWTPALPLAPRSVPTGPVLVEPAVLGSRREGPGPRLVLARLYPLASGAWAGLGAVEIGQAPSPERLMRRLNLEMLRLRRHERRSSWEDLLRSRPEVLYRSCAAAWWRRAEQESLCD